MDHSRQIFETPSPARWKSIKWTSRVVAIIVIFFLTVLIMALVRGSSPSLPNLQERSREYKNKLDPANPLTLSYSGNKKIKGFKDFLSRKQKEEGLNNRIVNPAKALPFIRAAFYTPWTAKTALPELEKNGDKLNTIFPEWFFIDTLTHTLQTRIDTAGLNLMRKKDLRIVPMLTNFNSSRGKARFDGDLLHGILNDPAKRSAFIRQLTDTIMHYQLQGVNIDFEELKEKSNVPLTNFQKELFENFHPRNLLVTMDVATRNDDYDYEKLAAYNDYVILMAYDQFNESSGAGPISSQKWIEDNLEWTAAKIDPAKIILGVAGYGYDWSNGKLDSTYTYNSALNKARSLNADIRYDNDSYNLHFSYTADGDGEKAEHEVWFTDAASTFNTLRFSDEFGTAGTALWRLGGEDSRIWKFYNRNLSNAALEKNPFDFNSLQTIPIIPNSVGFTGEGEVLSILYTPQEGKIAMEIDSAEQLIAEQSYLQLPSGYIIRKFAEDNTVGRGHKLILSFDDGPSDVYTPKILDILEREKIPASFFIVGLEAEKNIPLLRRIYKDGFEIGNHTFTHNNLAKMSLKRASIEMKATRLLIECTTGRSTILFRAPYNADSEPQTFEELEPIARSRAENYLTIGESIDPMDWQPGVTADSIFSRVVRQVEDKNASIILLHDAGGETRQATVDALPRIIKYFKDKGYDFTTIADLMGKTKNDVMPAVPESRDSWMMKMNFLLAEGGYWGSEILFSLFIVGIFLSVGRILLTAILAYRQKQKDAIAPAMTTHPAVSVIVPAYNEELNSIRTIESLLQQDYPNLEVIYVDDGSSDNSYRIVKDHYGQHPSVKVLTKTNGGKATALNYGINFSDNEFIVCIDADTQLKKDAVTELMKKFAPLSPGAEVGAVAGNVKVGNEVNMITRWQSIEYITSQNFDRRAFDLLNCITVVPGAIGAFRKKAVVEAGGFTSDTLAEDCDLTMRLHRCGYRIVNCTTAISYTEAPETMKQFLKQRFRWSFGVLQSFWKHRDALLNPRYKNFGLIAMPNILIFQVILPFLAPLADLVLVISLLAAAFGIIPASLYHIILYYFVFTVVDIAGAAIAFNFENARTPGQAAMKKENPLKLLWMIPQRLIYRQLMYYILIKSFNKALKGELQGWGTLKRTGNVKQVATV
ncbi:MAG: glycosyltransferase [Ferruginibacter sp.]|nr:glycosyltransferase [Ferruginibacter sp.]